MARKRSVKILSLLLAALLLAAFILFQAGVFGGKGGLGDGAAAAPVAGSSKPDEVIPVQARLVRPVPLTEFIVVSGSTMPTDEVNINSDVAGIVSKIFFAEGTFVKKGAPLVQLDDEELKAQRHRLEVNRDLTARIAERMKGLYEKEGVSLQEYEIAASEAEQVRAELLLLDTQLGKRTIRAPFSGRLGLRLVSEGSYLAPGTPIVRLVNLDPIKLEFSVPERYSDRVTKGSRVRFRLDGVEGEQDAVVEATEPTIDPATRSFRLKANAANPGGRILPGAFATVTVNLSKYPNAILIPNEAIIPEMGGKKVFVYRSGKAQPVVVETGIRQDAEIQVTSGLQPGDTVITTGVMQMRPGAEVRITELVE